MYKKKTGRVGGGFGKGEEGWYPRNPLIKGLFHASGPSLWKCLAAAHTAVVTYLPLGL